MKTKTIWMMLGVVLVLFLLFKSDFLGSVMTSCENNEPVTMIEYEAETSRMNGTFSDAQIYTLIQGNGSTNFPKRTSTSSLGDYTYIDVTGSISCSDFLKILNSEDNTTSFTKLSKREVLLTTTGIQWCNNENTIVIKSTLEGFSNYFEKYETCTDIIVEDLPPLPTSDYAKPTIIVNDEKEAETIPEPKNNTTWFIIAGVVALLLIYVIFEKGPKKGLIKRRR